MTFAVCVEVAEHLAPSRGPALVEELCALAPNVLFSAAIPGQGGTHHLNERWQSYWASLFRKHGYEPFDIIRPRVWDNSSVEYWYRQNCLLYVKNALPEAAMLDVIHPMRFEQVSLRANIYDAYNALSRLPRSLVHVLRRRVANFMG